VILSFPVTKKFRGYYTTNMRQNLKELAENVEKEFDKLVDWIRKQDPEIFSTRIASQKSTGTARQQLSIIAPPKSTRTASPKSSKEQLSEIQQYIESELKKIKKLPPLRLANCVYKKILDRLENKDENYDLYLSALDKIARSFNVNQKLLEIREHLLSPESEQHIPTPDLSDSSKQATHPQEKTRTDREKKLILPPLSDILGFDETKIKTIKTFLKKLRQQLKSETLQQSDSQLQLQKYIGLLQAPEQQRHTKINKQLQQNRSEWFGTGFG